MQAWHLYEDGGQMLSDESLENIKGALDLCAEDLVSLGQALEGLVRFSILLSDHQNDSIAAERVVSMMRQYTPLFEPFLERVAEAIAKVAGVTPAPENESPKTTTPAERPSHAEPHG
jgi:hypothetical protein